MCAYPARYPTQENTHYPIPGGSTDKVIRVLATSQDNLMVISTQDGKIIALG